MNKLAKHALIEMLNKMEEENNKIIQDFEATEADKIPIEDVYNAIQSIASKQSAMAIVLATIIIDMK